MGGVCGELWGEESSGCWVGGREDVWVVGWEGQVVGRDEGLEIIRACVGRVSRWVSVGYMWRFCLVCGWGLGLGLGVRLGR